MCSKIFLKSKGFYYNLLLRLLKIFKSMKHVILCHEGHWHYWKMGKTLANAACFIWVTKDWICQENRSNLHVLFDVLTRSVWYMSLIARSFAPVMILFQAVLFKTALCTLLHSLPLLEGIKRILPWLEELYESPACCSLYPSTPTCIRD